MDRKRIEDQLRPENPGGYEMTPEDPRGCKKIPEDMFRF